MRQQYKDGKGLEMVAMMMMKPLLQAAAETATAMMKGFRAYPKTADDNKSRRRVSMAWPFRSMQFTAKPITSLRGRMG